MAPPLTVGAADADALPEAEGDDVAAADCESRAEVDADGVVLGELETAGDAESEREALTDAVPVPDEDGDSDVRPEEDAHAVVDTDALSERGADGVPDADACVLTVAEGGTERVATGERDPEVLERGECEADGELLGVFVPVADTVAVDEAHVVGVTWVETDIVVVASVVCCADVMAEALALALTVTDALGVSDLERGDDGLALVEPDGDFEALCDRVALVEGETETVCLGDTEPDADRRADGVADVLIDAERDTADDLDSVTLAVPVRVPRPVTTGDALDVDERDGCGERDVEGDAVLDGVVDGERDGHHVTVTFDDSLAGAESVCDVAGDALSVTAAEEVGEPRGERLAEAELVKLRLCPDERDADVESDGAAVCAAEADTRALLAVAFALRLAIAESDTDPAGDTVTSGEIERRGDSEMGALCVLVGALEPEADRDAESVGRPQPVGEPDGWPEKVTLGRPLDEAEGEALGEPVGDGEPEVDPLPEEECDTSGVAETEREMDGDVVTLDEPEGEPDVLGVLELERDPDAESVALDERVTAKVRESVAVAIEDGTARTVRVAVPNAEPVAEA